MDIELRSWIKEDVEYLVKYANNYNIAKFLTNQFPHPYAIPDGERFIENVSKLEPTSIFCIVVDGIPSGSIGLHLQSDIHALNAELGYWLAEHLWGKGIMTHCIREVVKYGFLTFDINRIFARPFGSNNGSQRVLEKSGFLLEAKFERTLIKNGDYLDELIYAVRRQGTKQNP